jgi:hypothetical protein
VNVQDIGASAFEQPTLAGKADILAGVETRERNLRRETRVAIVIVPRDG